MGQLVVTLEDVRQAAQRIEQYVVRTPVERSTALSDAVGADVWLKYECFQLTGSFKLRGALNALMTLDDTRAAQGVITASAGNHGLGVARAAKLLGIPALVVVPETASQAKVDALRRSGAELVLHGRTYDEAETEGLRLSKDRRAPFISPYNDAAVVAGGGTVGLEILADVPDVRNMVVPAGGGGLVSGIAVAAHNVRPDVATIGVQSEASPALYAALAQNRVVPVEVGDSLADGLSGNIEPDSITFGLMRDHVRKVVLVSEGEIVEAMRWLVFNEHVVVEGSGAVGVAGLLGRRIKPSGPVAVVLSGRNVASSALEKVLHQ
jgi:threonine dehydratase